MKRLSFQWRITLMTALLIAAACIILNLLLCRSGAYYFDILGDYVVENIDSFDVLGEKEGIGPEDMVIIDMTEEDFNRFYENFSGELSEYKSGFGIEGWFITFIVTVLSSIVAYFVSGISLTPLRDFSAQAEQVQMKSLKEVKLSEDTVPEFQVLSQSFNRMLARLSEAFEAQKQFAGNAAHELRTPLALMQARLDLYKRESSHKCPKADETIDVLSEQTDRLSAMIKTLLAMSELESIPRSEKIQLAPMIEEVLTDLSPLAEQNDISLSQDGENICLTGSDVLLYRLFFNLIENGIKYNRSHGCLRVSISRDERNAIIHIRDTGHGIPEDCRKSVFQPFFRVDKSRSRSLGGVGLGLALVWEVANLHGGTVRIEESSPSGTLFSVQLPLE